jgi:hypothetical protein
MTTRRSNQALLALIVAVLIMPLAAANCQQSPRWYGGLEAGYNGGAGITARGLVLFPCSVLPAGVRIALSYSSTGPGDALAARRIFINDATNGVPEKSGRVWGLRGDVLIELDRAAANTTYLFTGLRRAGFVGNFKYIGGNEDFDIRSSHWGVGLGIENRLGISRKLALVLSGGLDYFFESTLTGHDTSYSPDGEDVNSRRDYRYHDADAAINQPQLELRLMIGFEYRL